MPSDRSHVDPALPDVDERLVASGSRHEIYDGKLVQVAPADELRGTRRSKVLALVEIYTGPEFDVACAMLTRTSETSDVAPDVSVFPRARDPQTGGRQLEHLVFEVVNSKSLSHAGRKAAKLLARGVRRVLAVDVERTCALEWSASPGSWSMLDPSAAIEDPVFAVPLPIKALVRDGKVDDAVADALLIKRNAVIEAALAARIVRATAELLIMALEARGVALGAAERTRILDERDPSTLTRWFTRAATCRDFAEVFVEA